MRAAAAKKQTKNAKFGPNSTPFGYGENVFACSARSSRSKQRASGLPQDLYFRDSIRVYVHNRLDAEQEN